MLQDEDLTREIIASAIEVHKSLGPGLLESIYEWALSKELELRNLSYTSQSKVYVEYKGFKKEEELRFDLFIENRVLVEVKSVEKLSPIHQAQLLSYMKLLKVQTELLVNFNSETRSFRRRDPTVLADERLPVAQLVTERVVKWQIRLEISGIVDTSE